jgi:hypothetical protein
MPVSWASSSGAVRSSVFYAIAVIQIESSDQPKLFLITETRYPGQHSPLSAFTFEGHPRQCTGEATVDRLKRRNLGLAQLLSLQEFLWGRGKWAVALPRVRLGPASCSPGTRPIRALIVGSRGGGGSRIIWWLFGADARQQGMPHVSSFVRRHIMGV